MPLNLTSQLIHYEGNFSLYAKLKTTFPKNKMDFVLILFVSKNPEIPHIIAQKLLDYIK